jgi:hypothetical protein
LSWPLTGSAAASGGRLLAAQDRLPATVTVLGLFTGERNTGPLRL